jgi:hypothetical protein
MLMTDRVVQDLLVLALIALPFAVAIVGLEGWKLLRRGRAWYRRRRRRQQRTERWIHEMRAARDLAMLRRQHSLSADRPAAAARTVVATNGSPVLADASGLKTTPLTRVK